MARDNLKAGNACAALYDLEPDERECAEAIIKALERNGRCRVPEADE